MPNALYKVRPSAKSHVPSPLVHRLTAVALQTGLIAGLLSALISMAISMWTMYILAALFLERKRDLVSCSLP